MTLVAVVKVIVMLTNPIFIDHRLAVVVDFGKRGLPRKFAHASHCPRPASGLCVCISFSFMYFKYQFIMTSLV